MPSATVSDAGQPGTARASIMSGQVVARVRPRDEQVRVRVRAEIGDAVTDELVRILLSRLDLGQQLLGPGQLLQPASRRSEPNLLIRQLLQGRVFEAGHSHHSLRLAFPARSGLWGRRPL